MASIALLPADYPEVERPKTRGDCANVPRPCPFVSCRYSLYLNVTKCGTIQFPRGLREVDELKDSCALDVAERGGVSGPAIARLLGITRQRVDQLEQRAKKRLKFLADRSHLEGMPPGPALRPIRPEVLERSIAVDGEEGDDSE